jgi:hypothetical protein
MGGFLAATYLGSMATATRRVSRAAVRSAPRELAPGYPIGAALLETLGDLNVDVRNALARERAKLNDCGYPEDLPLPALWWGEISAEA